MAGVKFEKGSREWYMFQDCWKLCQKYWIPEDNDGYWDAVVRESSEFMKKYEDVVMAREMALAFIESLEKQYRMDQN